MHIEEHNQSLYSQYIPESIGEIVDLINYSFFSEEELENEVTFVQFQTYLQYIHQIALMLRTVDFSSQPHHLLVEARRLLQKGATFFKSLKEKIEKDLENDRVSDYTKRKLSYVGQNGGANSSLRSL